MALTLRLIRQVTTDPHTGQQKVKKRFGGAYPGQKVPQHSPYVPPASAFGKDGQATAHFVAHGGGNALTLIQSDGSTAPQVGKYQPEYIQGMSAVCIGFLSNGCSAESVHILDDASCLI